MWIFSGLGRGARGATDRPAGPRPTRQELDRLRDANERLTRQVGHQQVLIAEMEQLLADLSGLRDQLIDLRAKIIIAPVVGGDAAPQRDTLAIGKGQRQGVRRGDWVAAGVIPEELPPAPTARDPLLRQWLIGRVSEVQPFLSRVQLATDARFGPQRVWTARELPDGTWEVGDKQCGLIGLGGGRMRIDRAAEDYHAADQPIVLAPLAHPQPMALAIGRIVGSETLETGLHYNLEVEPWGNVGVLSYVYVISLPQ